VEISPWAEAAQRRAEERKASQGLGEKGGRDRSRARTVDKICNSALSKQREGGDGGKQPKLSDCVLTHDHLSSDLLHKNAGKE